MVAKKDKTKKNWKINLNEALYYLSSILKDFSIALHVLIKPLTLIAIVPTILLLIFTQSQTGTARLVLDIITAFCASIAGGLVTHYVIEYTGNSFLIRKSVGSIRNLQLIKFKTKNVTERITEFKKENNNRDFEEIDNLVSNINKDILNSISDWGDVNPNSEKVADFYELVSEREQEIKKVKSEKEDLEKQKASLAQDKQSEKEQLEKAISDKNSEIWELRNELRKFNRNNISIVSGSVLSNQSETGGISLYDSNMCPKCVFGNKEGHLHLTSG